MLPTTDHAPPFSTYRRDCIQPTTTSSPPPPAASKSHNKDFSTAPPPSTSGGGPAGAKWPVPRPFRPSGMASACIMVNLSAFLHLFSTLSAWGPDGNLLLDISVYSPSDSEHWFKYRTFVPDITSNAWDQRQYIEQSMLVKATASDYDHGYDTSSRYAVAPSAVIYKIFDEIMDLGFVFESLVSDRLRKLVLFENFNQIYPAGFERLRNVDPIRIPSFHISRAVAKASLTLEHLSASFIVDACHFFAARELSWKWPNLTWLALTSQLLVPEESPEELNDMLAAAAAAAMKMPNLQIMEIWNGKKGLAMVFRYQRAKQRQPAVITWRGTWELALQPSVTQAWDWVTLSHGGQGHIIVKELLGADVCIQSHGDAIRHLRFSRPVIRPISLRQIQLEHDIRAGLQS
ncbi:hypothetical protein B7494_g7998 [Chlorociboria aeruginascens]|nr:hypothetical protein B7494_g7998 [Chlorociboria aeruginascens]